MRLADLESFERVKRVFPGELRTFHIVVFPINLQFNPA